MSMQLVVTGLKCVFFFQGCCEDKISNGEDGAAGIMYLGMEFCNLFFLLNADIASVITLSEKAIVPTDPTEQVGIQGCSSVACLPNPGGFKRMV